MTASRRGTCVNCGNRLSPDLIDLIPPVMGVGVSVGISCKKCGSSYVAPLSWTFYGVVLGFLAWAIFCFIFLAIFSTHAAFVIGVGAVVCILAYAGTIYLMLRTSRWPSVGRL